MLSQLQIKYSFCYLSCKMKKHWWDNKTVCYLSCGGYDKVIILSYWVWIWNKKV